MHEHQDEVESSKVTVRDLMAVLRAMMERERLRRRGQRRREHALLALLRVPLRRACKKRDL